MSSDTINIFASSFLFSSSSSPIDFLIDLRVAARVEDRVLATVRDEEGSFSSLVPDDRLRLVLRTSSSGFPDSPARFDPG